MQHFDCIPTPDMFIVSDMHLGHDKILEKEPKRYLGKKTPKKAFKNLCKRWNDVVGRNDVVLCLGDVIGYKGAKYLPKLHGIKFLIIGNHDIKPYNKAILLESDFRILKGMRLCIDDAQSIEEETLACFKNLSAYEQECLSVLVADVMNMRIMFCHYPLFGRYGHDERFFRLFELLEWLFKRCECDINIHGHSHSHNAADSRCVNASIDVTCYAPIKLRTLLYSASTTKGVDGF